MLQAHWPYNPPSMTTVIVIVFALVYLGMIFGRWPRLMLDRTGVALLGAIALLAAGALTLDDAWRAIDVPTIALLFGMMVVSAQLRLGGFYALITERIAALEVTPAVLLLALVFTVGGLSAVLTNDVVCLAVAPVLVHACTRRQLNPIPFLLALACAANVGSAATIIGNPQNILIGQKLNLSFLGYLADSLVPTVLGLLAVWGIIVLETGGRWHKMADPVLPERPGYHAWQTIKGLLVVTGVIVIFLFTKWPHPVVALAAGGMLLTSRKLHSRKMLGLVDWQLLVLFIGLFVVNHALQETRLPDQAVLWLQSRGVNLHQPGWLFLVTVVLSNVVSNVPAVMLLLPLDAHAQFGAILALASTLAGNLLLVGSIANLIVVDAASRQGIRIDWRQHAKVGVPVTMITLLLAAGWLGWRGA